MSEQDGAALTGGGEGGGEKEERVEEMDDIYANTIISRS